MKLAGVAMAVVLSSAAWAQEAPPAANHPGEGDYGGAVPGAPQREKHKTRKGPNLLTWIGFQKTGDSGARVFLRVTSSVVPEQHASGDELVVRLPGFHLDVKNNGRPLNTKYFGTDVVRVRAAEGGGGIDVRVSFAKAAREGKVSSEAAPEADGGGQFVYLDF